MSEELKPCPWYESRKKFHDELFEQFPILMPKVRELPSAYSTFSVRCGCGGEGPFADSEAEAIAAWNRRSLPKEVACTPRII